MSKIHQPVNDSTYTTCCDKQLHTKHAQIQVSTHSSHPVTTPLN